MPASTATLSKVGVTATVLMMSAATRNSSPSRIARPRLDRKSAIAASRFFGPSEAQYERAQGYESAKRNDSDSEQLDELGNRVSGVGGEFIQHQSLTR